RASFLLSARSTGRRLSLRSAMAKRLAGRDVSVDPMEEAVEARTALAPGEADQVRPAPDVAERDRSEGSGVGGVVAIVAEDEDVALRDSVRPLAVAAEMARLEDEMPCLTLSSWKSLHVEIGGGAHPGARGRSEEHTSELQSRENLVCR